jgi:serine phosphatase RsbU (regulator of sigma subunit)
MPTAFSTHAPTQTMFPFTAGDMVSFYVDGATEARNVVDVFLVLAI